MVNFKEKIEIGVMILRLKMEGVKPQILVVFQLRNFLVC